MSMSFSIVQLHSKMSSMIISLKPAPEVVYWGKNLPPLAEHDIAAFMAAYSRPVGQARLDLDVPLTLCPELGRGSFGASGIEGHRSGQQSMPIFSYASHQQKNNELHIQCVDSQALLSITIALSMDVVTGVIKKNITLKNESIESYGLNKLALTLPVPYRAKDLESYYGRWSREFQSQRHQLEHGLFAQENRRGRTSHEYFPGCLVGESGFSDEYGEVWGFHLGWSGNHHWRCEAKSDGRRFVQAGELLNPGEVELVSGEVYTTPDLFATYSPKGINGVRSATHKFVRNQIIRFDKAKPRPVHLNTWEGIYFEHNPDYICDMATQAAAMGVERFIIDDGWFEGRNDDTSSLGDWSLDRSKYPDGLEPVIAHVNQQGMEFGIWIEPEMVNEDSNLYRLHPEWVLTTKGYPTPKGRNQWVLNLQNQECFDYLYGCFDQLLSTYNIGYIKWDMNREIVQPTHDEKSAVHGQTHALYRLLDKLVLAHPKVEFESCSSGGGRIDYEILQRTCRFWASDCNDALERQTIQKNMSVFFPPEVMGAHIGPQDSHTTRRHHDINLRGVTALFGHMGVELDPVKESVSERAAFSKYIDLYKQYRTLIHSGEMRYLDNADKSRQVLCVGNQEQLIVSVCQLTMPDYALPEPVRFQNLQPNHYYHVSLLEFPEPSRQLMKVLPDWMKSKCSIRGDVLQSMGLSLPILDPESALILLLEHDGDKGD